ncbi:hypothetical protein Y032_0008g360 [Ancylostoma ceylanicum]|uniref:RNA exonuclease 1 homolog-like domain-containing protein n=2 Tax=Ancylostoma ceylanicum TaxID=53326 RepID=A0A016VMB3_9BILA|nr:hypothetical protein Y032_0008g360 [Ancylostoma ceylanicum]
MFRGSGVLSELLCPRSGCDRVHCRFFHEGRSESHGIGDGCLDTPPFPCEPQDYKFAFPSDAGVEESGPTTSSYTQPDSDSISPCPYRIPGSNTIGDVPRDLSRIHSIRDFGYLPHTPSAPTHGPSIQPFSPFENATYTSYHVQSSKYAPEEPGVVSSDSFSGYAPAPSPSNSTHTIYAPTPHSINSTEPASCPTRGEGYVEKSLPNELIKEESATTSQATRVSNGIKQEPPSVDSHVKTSTAKKIKTLPLPRVPIPSATKSKSEQFKEYVGEVARLNEEIERLQRLQEQLRQEAKKIAGSSGEIPSSVVQSTQELLERSSSSYETSELADSNRCARKSAPPRERPVVAEYTPTPLADLQRMKEEELKRKKLKEGKKREVTKDRGRTEQTKRRPISEDEMSLLFGVGAIKLFFLFIIAHLSIEDDEVEPKPKKAREEASLVAKKATNRKSKPEASSSTALDAAHKDSHSSDSVMALDTKSSVGCEHLKQSSASSNSVSKPTEISPDVVAAAKKRIAREKAEDRRAMVAASVRKAPTAREQLHARMNAVAKEKSTTPTSSKTLTNMKPLTQEQMYGHRADNTIGSIAKGEARTARSLHAAGSDSDTGMPKLRDPTNQKIPYSVRVTFLKRIFDQYLEVCPRVEAIRNSEIEEKAIVDKVRHTQSYKVAVINLIGRIRNAKSTGLGKARAALSHDAVLAGRHVNDISVRVRKSSKNNTPSLTEKEFYNVLINKYLMTDEQLIRNGYPRAVPGDDHLVSIAQSHFEISKAQKSWAAKDEGSSRAAYSNLTIQDQGYFDVNDEKMDVNWNIDCRTIETRSSPLVIEFGGKPIPIELVFWSYFLQTLPSDMIINQEID